MFSGNIRKIFGQWVGKAFLFFVYKNVSLLFTLFLIVVSVQTFYKGEIK